MLGACLLPQALERELAPVEERLSKLEQMARKVVRASSTEGREVNERKAEINALWDKLKVCMCVMCVCLYVEYISISLVQKYVASMDRFWSCCFLQMFNHLLCN